MKKSFFPEKGIWLKGNLHAHTTRSDGMCPPAQQIKDYIDHGYDFLAITDHNVIDSHQLGETSSGLRDANSGLVHGDRKICMIPGWERDIRHCPDNTKCIHVLGLVASPASETDITEVRRYECLEVPDQQLLDEMSRDGQYVVLAHPHWSRMTPSEVLKLTGFHAIEVFNTGCERLMHAGRADLYWDLLLQSGRRVWGVATDDTHGKTRKSDRFGGWVMVRSEEKTAPAIIAQLLNGDYYFSQGPKILDWGIEDDPEVIPDSPLKDAAGGLAAAPMSAAASSVAAASAAVPSTAVPTAAVPSVAADKLYFRCSPCQQIHVTSYPPRGASFYAPEGEQLTELVYQLKGSEQYVRIECIDAQGRTAWTNPHFF